METAAGSRARLVLDGLAKGGECVVGLAKLEKSSTESLADAAVLGVEGEPAVQPLLGRPPILASLRHRGQARECFAAKDRCLLGVPWPGPRSSSIWSKLSRASLILPSPRRDSTQGQVYLGIIGCFRRGLLERMAGRRGLVGVKSNRARINRTGGHSGCLAAFSLMMPRASSIFPSRAFAAATSSSFSAGTTTLAAGGLG